MKMRVVQKRDEVIIYLAKFSTFSEIQDNMKLA